MSWRYVCSLSIPSITTEYDVESEFSYEATHLHPAHSHKLLHPCHETRLLPQPRVAQGESHEWCGRPTGCPPSEGWWSEVWCKQWIVQALKGVGLQPNSDGLQPKSYSRQCLVLVGKPKGPSRDDVLWWHAWEKNLWPSEVYRGSIHMILLDCFWLGSKTLPSVGELDWPKTRKQKHPLSLAAFSCSSYPLANKPRDLRCHSPSWLFWAATTFS